MCGQAERRQRETGRGALQGSDFWGPEWAGENEMLCCRDSGLEAGGRWMAEKGKREREWMGEEGLRSEGGCHCTAEQSVRLGRRKGEVLAMDESPRGP